MPIVVARPFGHVILSFVFVACANVLAGCSDSAGPANEPSPTTSGKVTLNWARPTSNEDGSALTDLAGYKVYYGTAPYALESSVDVRGANVTSVEIQELAHGPWYFAIASYNATGVESSKSGVVTTTI